MWSHNFVSVRLGFPFFFFSIFFLFTPAQFSAFPICSNTFFVRFIQQIFVSNATHSVYVGVYASSLSPQLAWWAMWRFLTSKLFLWPWPNWVHPRCLIGFWNGMPDHETLLTIYSMSYSLSLLSSFFSASRVVIFSSDGLSLLILFIFFIRQCVCVCVCVCVRVRVRPHFTLHSTR
jgi:hypothetical protein